MHLSDYGILLIVANVVGLCGMALSCVIYTIVDTQIGTMMWVCNMAFSIICAVLFIVEVLM